MTTPAIGEYPSYLGNYIRLVGATSVTNAVEKHSDMILDFFQKIPADKITYRYAEGKWNLKEVLQHIIDTERIFAYRALRLARHDKTSLPGFDENAFAAASNADLRDWEGLLAEFKAVRKSTDLLLESFTEEQLNETGLINGNPVSTNAIGFIIYGHILHHINVTNERYL